MGSITPYIAQPMEALMTDFRTIWRSGWHVPTSGGGITSLCKEKGVQMNQWKTRRMQTKDAYEIKCHMQEGMITDNKDLRDIWSSLSSGTDLNQLVTSSIYIPTFYISMGKKITCLFCKPYFQDSRLLISRNPINIGFLDKSVPRCSKHLVEGFFYHFTSPPSNPKQTLKATARSVKAK